MSRKGPKSNIASKVYLLLFFILTMENTHGFAQGNNSKNEEIHEYRKFIGADDKQLKVGDEMVDIPLGTVINGHLEKTKFSDYYDKLIILDFWTTGCSNCIAAFPKMQKLQDEFNEKIQVFLVNSFENEEQISRRLKQKHLQGYSAASLPMIVNAVDLLKLFPHLGVPHHVWIYKGKIVLIGSHLNTYSEKIKALLEGRVITFMRDDNNSRSYDEDDAPYFKLIDKYTSSIVQYSSFFTTHNNYVAPLGQARVTKDTIAKTSRYSYINFDVLELYAKTLSERYREKWAGKLVGPNNIEYLDFFVLNTEDTLSLTCNYLKNGQTDEQFVKNHFCFEQVVPQDISDEERRIYMLQDLNRYFGNLLHTECLLIPVKIPCYVIVQKQVSVEGNASGMKNGGRDSDSVKYLDCQLSDAILNSLTDLFRKTATPRPYVFDESGRKIKGDFTFPLWGPADNLDSFKSAIACYNLDIVKTERVREMLIIKNK
ncbi:MAG: thioredoxin family protein [Candidatus Pseudobacter hemicellulosilyticus]|uniref:Thioredoxin family protein n=1 Tax=Candidatus Pseudobacter hemicellulosilyticus TaxID=3121375 RepID=A0AAJ5WUQ0_9BACT|nr:MAG: thioredoxin family protein [Pseudobacter sp.]